MSFFELVFLLTRAVFFGFIVLYRSFLLSQKHQKFHDEQTTSRLGSGEKRVNKYKDRLLITALLHVYVVTKHSKGIFCGFPK